MEALKVRNLSCLKSKPAPKNVHASRLNANGSNMPFVCDYSLDFSNFGNDC